MGALLTVENLNEQVYEKIRSDIVSGKFAPGTRIIDLQIADQYGISRTPVRDAIQRLTREGLVVTSGKKGYYVFKATRQDIVEIFEVRLMLDKAVVEKLITELMPNSYQLYFNTVQQIENRLEEGILRGPKAFTEYDEEFHDSIVGLCNNSRIVGIYRDNSVHTKAFRSMTSFSAERIDKANKLHFELLDAIKNMDRERALQAVLKHVEFSRKDALDDEEKEESKIEK